MSKETLQEINDYLEYESCFTGKMRKLKNYKKVEYDKNKEYLNLYEGGNYVYDEKLNTYFYCNIIY